MNTSLPRGTRIAAFNNRLQWLRAIDGGSVADVMMKMVAHFGAMGLVESRPGIKADPDIPEVILVETLAGSRLKAMALAAAQLQAKLPRAPTRLERAGWQSEAHLEEARNARFGKQ